VGTAAAPAEDVNPATIQKPASNGRLPGVAVIVAQTSFTGSYGKGTPQMVYTADEDGFYSVWVYINAATPGTCATAPCAGEAIAVQWNDGISKRTQDVASCSLVTSCAASAVTPVWVKSGQVIAAHGQSYGAGAAPLGGSYNAHVLVEKLPKQSFDGTSGSGNYRLRSLFS
jgi:hypothetical protein